MQKPLVDNLIKFKPQKEYCVFCFKLAIFKIKSHVM